ncbi:hypothetical protein BX666DRAFT_2017097 [Dichotomocladium elegans]|nr:hypothetical protein BX666DRAFT_2017097 [Dichotomocladium elegans]
MSSPIQPPPPNIRRSPSSSSLPQPSLPSTGPPFVQQLPPPPHGPSRAQAGTPPPPLTGSSSTLPPPPPPQQQQQQKHNLITATNNTNPNTSTTNNAPTSTPVSASTTTNSNSSSNYRPLNVRDALTYLDQVKVQFSARPDVYNQFLDIMKDFKSQAIDTPGVIERVSILFNGHPDLISGFNTFLPPGYRIDCSTDPNEPDVIKVTTPTGTTVTRTSRPVLSNAIGNTARGSLRDQENGAAMVHGGPLGAGAPAPHPPPPPSAAGSYYQPPYGHMPPPHPPTSLPPPPPPQAIQQPPMSSQMIHSAPRGSYMPGATTAAPGSRRPQHQPLPTPVIAPHEHQEQAQLNGRESTRRAPVEFNHAINYNRFSNDPDTYKQFLEILQTYQKERKPIQEVYSHVSYLFNGAPDLLREFKQFLPEISGQSAPDYLDDLDSAYINAGPKRMYGASPQCGSFMPSTKRRRNIEEDMIHGYPTSSYFDPSRPAISLEEVDLFEQIRKHIGNKPSYEEFLKTLNLFTQQIIDADILMKQVEGFLGNDRELFDWFKSVVAVDLKDHTIERPAKPIPKPDLIHCETVDSSPSYRLVSKDWQNQPCSGRDQLCWEVLNDEYVSHPIWASEDDGFVASKKNQYEEAMHRCEEERYDYDLNIDANLNTIALLEPISKKLETMSAEEKNNFRLPPGLGGQSVTIYERIIKKIYEPERGREIVEMLYNNPARVVPILLKRLKQKDEEWRKAQHEWNKTWREMDAKNFYRSLDYQGLTFKSNDRKAMAVKSLVSEIESLHEEAKTGQKNPKKPAYPLLFTFEDPEVFKDITRLIFSYIEKQNGFSSNDRSKIRTFVRIFIALFFHVDDVVPEGMNIESDDGEDQTSEEEDENHSVMTEESDADMSRSPRERSRSPSAGVRRRSGRSRTEEADTSVDLLRDVLTKNKSTHTDDNDTVNSDDTPSASRDLSVTPAPEDDDEEENLSNAEEKPIKTEKQEGNRLFAAAAAATAPNVHKRTAYSFFCNTPFYCFFRLYQLMYERLLKMKQLNAQAQGNREKGKRVNKVANDLGLYTNRFDDIDISNGFYNALLDLIDRFFEGDLDQAMYEEKARYLFVTDAHVLFTVDKLVHSIIKQIQHVTMDSKSVELVELFRSDQMLDSTCPRITSVYRLRAEEIVGSEENLYKANFNTDTHRMTIQLLDKDDDMLELNPQDSYENYVASYMDWANSTDGIDTTKMQPTFLRRLVDAEKKSRKLPD